MTEYARKRLWENLTVMFGSMNVFAIETGAVGSYRLRNGLFVQMRFWIDSIPIGDWSDRISLTGSVEYANTACAHQLARRLSPVDCEAAEAVCDIAYHSFFRDAQPQEAGVLPDIRERYHLDGIGMGVVEDKYGIVLVATSTTQERVLAIDLSDNRVVADVIVPDGYVEAVLREYVVWGRARPYVAATSWRGRLRP